MQAFFETPTAHKQLADIGRKMQDYSEDYGKVNGLGHLKEEGFKTLNDLSDVGSKLIRYGVVFGTTLKDFSDADMMLITKFLKNELVFASK
jgi:hypothetical protein